MNEHDDDIAQLFAERAPLLPSAEFATAVEQAIDAERRKIKLLAVGGAAGLILIAILGVWLLPAGLLYPLRVMHEFLTSMTGMLACVASAAFLATWVRFSEA
jgi:hypothetical protein